jgi:hypothetical protein
MQKHTPKNKHKAICSRRHRRCKRTETHSKHQQHSTAQHSTHQTPMFEQKFAAVAGDCGQEVRGLK